MLEARLSVSTSDTICGEAKWLPSDSESEDDFHTDSCSPVAGRRGSPFISRNGVRRLRRTAEVMLEEVRIRSLWEQHKDDLGIQFPGEKLHPIQMAAHLGDRRAVCFLLLDGGDPHTSLHSRSLLDLATDGRSGGAQQVISLLKLRAAPNWEELLLEQWDEDAN